MAIVRDSKTGDRVTDDKGCGGGDHGVVGGGIQYAGELQWVKRCATANGKSSKYFELFRR